MTAAERALEFVKDGDLVGLGSGRAATAFIHSLGARVKAGLRVKGVPTSEATAALARQLGIALTTLDNVTLDIAIDGADEVDPQLDLIKGYGGALVREKIVAAAAKKFVVLVGSEKLVSALGTRGKLPVEVVPFGMDLCRRRLLEIGCEPIPRLQDGGVFVTDNGNHILDCKVSTITHPQELEQRILSIPGVVGTGLFIGMADTVLIDENNTVQMRQRKR